MFSEEAISKDLVNCLALDLTLETIVAVEICKAIGRAKSKIIWDYLRASYSQLL